MSGQVEARASVASGWPRVGGTIDLRVNSRFGLDSLPECAAFGQVSAVATDADGNVYAFQRGPRADPVVVFDRDGNFVRSWGKGIRIPHAIRIDAAGNVWITDIGTHLVVKFDRSGRALLTLGTSGRSGTDERTFDQPTDVAVGPDGDVFVSDGYGNSRIVRFAADGHYRSTWGSAGTAPGEFRTPHAIAADADGLLYVSDRANERIQVFDEDGRLRDTWTHLGATQGIDVGPGGDVWVITFRDLDELVECDSIPGRLVRVRRSTGEVLGSIEAPGHWVHAASNGDVYLGALTGNVIRCSPRSPAGAPVSAI